MLQQRYLGISRTKPTGLAEATCQSLKWRLNGATLGCLTAAFWLNGISSLAIQVVLLSLLVRSWQLAGGSRCRGRRIMKHIGVISGIEADGMKEKSKRQYSGLSSIQDRRWASGECLNAAPATFLPKGRFERRQRRSTAGYRWRRPSQDRYGSC
jgi:hypothetical protein